MGYQECQSSGCGNPVFAAGLCRKHYEQERLARAAPCSVSGCQEKSFRAGKCAPHYRAGMQRLRPICSVPNCGQPQKNLTAALCGRHEFRLRTHGTVAQTRAADWGARESHPLYATWSWHKRKGDEGMSSEWREDFWAFAAAVGDRPGNHTLRRRTTTMPLGVDNWVWKPSTSSKDKAAYARQWRKANPEKAKNADLKKHFGVTLAEYEALFASQNGVCAICLQPERSKAADGGPRAMPVDHCHKSGKVRGLLCTACNRGLGMFGDSEATLLAAINYLKKSNKLVDPSVPE